MTEQGSKSTDLLLQGLNPEQMFAAAHGDGPLLVLAGAGTGKTMVLAFRIAYLLSQGVKPEYILLVTFTRKAAREMIDRVGQIVGHQVAERIWHGTFHSLGLRLVRQYDRAIRLKNDFSVMDQADAADLLNLARTDPDAMAEEARIAYVAVTRPRHMLYVSYCSRQLSPRMNDDIPAQLSRLLQGGAHFFEQQTASTMRADADDVDDEFELGAVESRALWK